MYDFAMGVMSKTRAMLKTTTHFAIAVLGRETRQHGMDRLVVGDILGAHMQNEVITSMLGRGFTYTLTCCVYNMQTEQMPNLQDARSQRKCLREEAIARHHLGVGLLL